MWFASDNTGPAAPEIMEAVAAANEGYAKPYGADPLTARVQDRIVVPVQKLADSIQHDCLRNGGCLAVPVGKFLAQGPKAIRVGIMPTLHCWTN